VRRPPRLANLLLVALLAGPAAVRGTAAPRDDAITPASLTDRHLTAAIDAIAAELVARKDPKRFWEPARPPRGESQRQGGGTTALVVLSLLYSGQSYQDPRLRDAVEHLESAELEGTYAVAVRAHVWAQLPERFRPALEADARWLLQAFSTRSLAWDYGAKPRSTYKDNSLRQYGALGLWEAAKRGVPVPERLWEALEKAFLECQLPDGGWNYAGDDKPPRGSMTAAGLTILFIAQDLLHAEDHARINEHRRESPTEQAISRGLTWMEQRFSPTEHPGSPAYFYYYLYGVERVGLASGYQRFGEHDWFREGACELVQRFCRWDEDGRRMVVRGRTGGSAPGANVDTRDLAFALMFLCRGRVPVAVNKLRTPGIAWNNRPRDAANLVRALSDRTERLLSWQIVDLEADATQWLDAPMLYLASHEALPWAPAEEGPAAASPLDGPPAELRTYLDRGGLLVAFAEGGRDFAPSVQALGRRLYPELSWRTLPRDHWIFGLHEPVNRRPEVLALGNGVRELILLVPRGDLPRSFQIVDQRREDDFRLMANVYFHASEMNRPRPRLGRSPAVEPPPSRPPSGASVIRAVCGGATTPEPAALPALAEWLERSRGAALRIEDRALADIAGAGPPPALVICSGVEARPFADDEREALRRFVTGGGTVLFETTGGLGDFAASAEQQTSALFAAEPVLLGESPVVTGRDLQDGADLSRIGFRPFAQARLGLRATAPRLRGLIVDGAPRVLFSHEDLSHALLDQPCWGISGYTADGARRLLSNVIQHGARLRQPATGAPGDE
jgi:hypothetical protein